MYPPIFEVCAADPAVTALLGTDPVRLFPFGEAPQDSDRPYAVWQVVTGAPENYVNQIPDIDSWTVQIDVYAPSVAESRNIAQVLRNAVEPEAHVVLWGGEYREPTTNFYRYSFDVDWFTNRGI